MLFFMLSQMFNMSESDYINKDGNGLTNMV